MAITQVNLPDTWEMRVKQKDLELNKGKKRTEKIKKGELLLLALDDMEQELAKLKGQK